MNPEPAALRGPEREAYIIRRRADRATFVQIGTELGISAQRVHAIWKKVVDRLPAQHLAEYRSEQLDLLDRAARGLIEIAEGVINGPRTRVEAWSAVIRLEDRRAKLLGLDAPSQRHLTVITDELLDAEMERLENELRAGDMTLAEIDAIGPTDDNH